MFESKLHPSTQIHHAEWLRSRLRGFGSGVAAVVPDHFPAYVRILHPARDENDEPITWADVANRSGSMMHRLAQFHAIARSDPFDLSRPSPYGIRPPNQGNLPANLLLALSEVLAEHTTTEDSCWFCLWEGYGWIPGSPARSAPKVNLPHRNYFFLTGPLSAASELGSTTAWGSFAPQSPNLFWPQDHSWCVASEIDLFCTLIAGSEELAQALVRDSRFEAWHVLPVDPIMWDSDVING